MTAPQKLTLHLSFAWWLKPYLAMLVFWCRVMQAEPDWPKVERTVCRAMRLRAVPLRKPRA